MAKPQTHKRHQRVYASVVLTSKTIAEQPEQVQLFNLEGVGHGWWETDGNAVELTSADCFVIIHWINAPRGAYRLGIDIRDESGTLLVGPLYEEVVEIPSAHHVRHFNVPMAGLVVPVGMHYLWVTVDGTPKAPACLRVFGPDASHAGTTH